jgi:formylmethanofuran dehydrogenase subunit E
MKCFSCGKKITLKTSRNVDGENICIECADGYERKGDA